MEMSRVRLPILRQAIDDLAGEKYGQKLNAIVARTIKSMKGMYAKAMEDAKAVELDRFHDAYKFRSHEVFASARYSAVAQSMNKARRPASLPEEVHLQKLESFIATEIERVTIGRSRSGGVCPPAVLGCVPADVVQTEGEARNQS